MPMVTQHDLADITDLEAGRKRIVDALPKGTPKITMTVLAVKACVAALKEFPRFNSSYDMNAGKLVVKKYYHLGIAVDTERGLVVPVIRDADKKSVRDLAAEVAALADKARNNKLALDEMRGRHVHHHQPRRDRRHRVRPDRELPRSRDPRSVAVRASAHREGRADCGAADDAAIADLRSPKSDRRARTASRSSPVPARPTLQRPAPPPHGDIRPEGVFTCGRIKNSFGSEATFRTGSR